MKNPMHDTSFLLALDNDHNKIIYAKLISLTQDEQPIEAIEGVVQSGSINLDGKSAVRHSCSLTMTTKKLNINEIYWGFTTKVKIEIGVQNNINSEYDKIIWFKQGIFILTDFKTSQQVNNYTITLSGKDKMCLLNGDISGHFNAENNLGVEDYIDELGQKSTTKIPLQYIIREMVHYYAHEPWANIIINDLEDYGLELIDNNSTNTYYLWRNIATGQYENITGKTEDGTIINSLVSPEVTGEFNIPPNCNFVNGMEEDANSLIATNPPTKVRVNGNDYYIFKVDPQATIGYQRTDLTFDKELIAAAGDTVTSILDKIVKMLGPFEYFYNIDGQFVFQAKATYLKTRWKANEVLDAIDGISYIRPSMMQDLTGYYFENGSLLTAMQNNPQMLNVRNDFTIWGKKRASNGSEIPIHARYAIDKKPIFYVPRKTNEELGREDNPIIYATTEGKNLIQSANSAISDDCFKEVDWRELLFQMAKDYYQYNHDDDMELQIILKNKAISQSLNRTDYLTGRTGYEQYYHDIEGFWRLLYDPSGISENEKLGVTYGPDGWNSIVMTNPTDLIFWFDFYETDNSLIDKFSIPAIGDRTKVVNDDNVRVIIYPDTPDIIYAKKTGDEEEALDDIAGTHPGYCALSVNDALHEIFRLSVRKKSAKETLDNLLYNHSHTNDSITLTSIPIYYLQPNSIIHVHDDFSHIDGYYEVTKLTVPLAYNGTMSIQAAKIPQQIY